MVPWHQTMTCQEYDVFLANPASFKSWFTQENERAETEIMLQRARREAQEDRDRIVAQRLMDDVQREEDRRQQELERQAREERDRREREAKERQWKAEQEQREKARREADNARQTMNTIRRTTKNCPGCSAPIEKNMGW
jgi:hypothetical protein